MFESIDSKLSSVSMVSELPWRAHSRHHVETRSDKEQRTKLEQGPVVPATSGADDRIPTVTLTAAPALNFALPSGEARSG